MCTHRHLHGRDRRRQLGNRSSGASLSAVLRCRSGVEQKRTQVMQDEVVDKAAVHDDPARSSSKADEPVALEEKERAADSGGLSCNVVVSGALSQCEQG